MNSAATVNLFFDQRRLKKDGTYPVKLNVYCQGEKRRYNTSVSVSKADWVKINGARLKDSSLKPLRDSLDDAKQKAAKIIEDLKEFDFESFEELYLKSDNIQLSRRGLVDLYNETIKLYRSNGNEGSARAYQDSLNAFQKFKPNLSFKDVTPEFLNSFEKYFIKEGKSLTSVGIYSRQLRAIFNEAITRGLVKKEQYPFAKYKIPGGYNKKKSLTQKEIKSVFEFQSESQLEKQAVAFWKLSYLCNGMNIGDLLRLRKENIQADYIMFNRAKTINTKKTESKTIQVALLPETKHLLEVWGKKGSLRKDEYIFPILEAGMTPAKQKDVIKSFNRKINQQLEKVASRLELTGRLSNMTARHSFATTLKRNHVTAEMIGDLLGHSNIKTTQNYLGSFTDETILNTTKKLIQFT